MSDSDTAAAEPGEIRPEALAKLQQWGGEKLVCDIIEVFLKSTPERASAIIAGQAAGDLAAVRAASHALKSSSGQLGAVTLQGICQELEHAAEAGNGTLVAARIQAFAQSFQAVSDALHKRLSVSDCNKATL